MVRQSARDSRVTDWPLVTPTGWQVGKLGFPGATGGKILAVARPVLRRERPMTIAPPIELGLQAWLVFRNRQTKFKRAFSAKLACVVADDNAQLIGTETGLNGGLGNLNSTLRADDLHWRPAAKERWDRMRDTELPRGCVIDGRITRDGIDLGPSGMAGSTRWSVTRARQANLVSKC